MNLSINTYCPMSIYKKNCMTDAITFKSVNKKVISKMNDKVKSKKTSAFISTITTGILSFIYLKTKENFWKQCEERFNEDEMAWLKEADKKIIANIQKRDLLNKRDANGKLLSCIDIKHIAQLDKNDFSNIDKRDLWSKTNMFKGTSIGYAISTYARYSDERYANIERRDLWHKTKSDGQPLNAHEIDILIHLADDETFANIEKRDLWHKNLCVQSMVTLGRLNDEEYERLDTRKLWDFIEEEGTGTVAILANQDDKTYNKIIELDLLNKEDANGMTFPTGNLVKLAKLDDKIHNNIEKRNLWIKRNISNSRCLTILEIISYAKLDDMEYEEAKKNLCEFKIDFSKSFMC